MDTDQRYSLVGFNGHERDLFCGGCLRMWFTAPGGSGKTTAVRALRAMFPMARNVWFIDLDTFSYWDENNCWRLNPFAIKFVVESRIPWLMMFGVQGWEALAFKAMRQPIVYREAKSARFEIYSQRQVRRDRYDNIKATHSTKKGDFVDAQLVGDVWTWTRNYLPAIMEVEGFRPGVRRDMVEELWDTMVRHNLSLLEPKSDSYF